MKHVTGNHAQAPVLQRLHELCCQCRGQIALIAIRIADFPTAAETLLEIFFAYRYPLNLRSKIVLFTKTIVDQWTKHAECTCVPDVVLCFAILHLLHTLLLWFTCNSVSDLSLSLSLRLAFSSQRTASRSGCVCQTLLALTLLYS